MVDVITPLVSVKQWRSLISGGISGAEARGISEAATVMLGECWQVSVCE